MKKILGSLITFIFATIVYGNEIILHEEDFKEPPKYEKKPDEKFKVWEEPAKKNIPSWRYKKDNQEIFPQKEKKNYKFSIDLE